MAGLLDGTFCEFLLHDMVEFVVTYYITTIPLWNIQQKAGNWSTRATGIMDTGME